MSSPAAATKQLVNPTKPFWRFGANVPKRFICIAAPNDALGLARESGDRRAGLAVEIFCYRVRKYVGAYLAALGGADALVFTGGIGENSAEVRERVCEGLEWMGVELDDEANRATTARREGLISRAGSRLAVYVIPTDEELLIARDTVRLIRGVTQRF